MNMIKKIIKKIGNAYLEGVKNIYGNYPLGYIRC